MSNAMSPLANKKPVARPVERAGHRHAHYHKGPPLGDVLKDKLKILRRLFLARWFRRDERAFVEIALNHSDQIFDLILEEVISPGDNLVTDNDAFLRFELVHERLDGTRRDHAVSITVNHQAGGRAGREKAEIIQIGRRGDSDEA